MSRTLSNKTEWTATDTQAIDKYHRHAEQKKPDTREYAVCTSIYNEILHRAKWIYSVTESRLAPAQGQQ